MKYLMLLMIIISGCKDGGGQATSDAPKACLNVSVNGEWTSSNPSPIEASQYNDAIVLDSDCTAYIEDYSSVSSVTTFCQLWLEYSIVDNNTLDLTITSSSNDSNCGSAGTEFQCSYTTSEGKLDVVCGSEAINYTRM